MEEFTADPRSAIYKQATGALEMSTAARRSAIYKQSIVIWKRSPSTRRNTTTERICPLLTATDNHST
ncbi:hypothetical protein DVK07_09685 [Halorubrum sp. Atlit-26R]|nr:hypothetical protein DVK07_09685 [Halorubrum sp. Atlit-26R]